MSSTEYQFSFSDLTPTLHLTTALVYIFILLVVFSLTKRWFLPDGQLPGPLSLPILGNLYVIFFNPSNFITVLTKLSRFYGNVYSFRMGAVPAIVVCGYDCVREVLVTKAKAFNDRPLLGYMKDHPEHLGIFFQNGKRWTYLRKLTLRTIHSFNKARPQNIRRYIHDEMQELVGFFKAKNEAPFDPKDILSLVTANTLCSIMLNRRFDYSDKHLKGLVHIIDRMFQIEGYGQMEHFIPALRHLKHLGIGVSYEDEILKLREEIKAFIRREDCCSSILTDGDEVVQSLADSYRKLTDEDADLVITVCILDMLQAAIAATKASASWITLYMARFPEIRWRCQKELDQVFGDEELDYSVTEDQLPFVTATMNEIMRITTPIPTAAPHEATQDVTLNGYNIEKGTLVLVNLYSVNNEQEYWKDPHVFRPSRFLDAQGNFDKTQRNLSFGAGPRGCLGKAIAKKMVFSFFVTMLKNFDISYQNGSAPSLQGVLNIAYEPLPYQIVARPRT